MAQAKRGITAASYALDPPKCIIALCDGTGKNGDADDHKTNVYQLYKKIQSSMSKTPATTYSRYELTPRYFPGIGCESTVASGYLAKVFGKNIVTCESDLVQQWKIRENGVPWAVRVTPDPVPVEYLGVWDTVGRIYTPPRLSEVKDMFGIPDEELPLGVEHALHAVAFHENRRLFRVTLFDRKKNQNNNTDLQEVWFPGAHADVGGGDRETDLSNISLNWMISKVDMFSHLKKNAVNHGTSQKLVPRDAFHETSLPKRVVDHEETRIQSQTLRWNSEIHQTVELLQERLPKETRLATLDDLRKTGWNRLGYIVPCSNHLKPDQEVEQINQIESIER
ncbi:hypothetical protein FRC09_004187 [Ceratobasidium sp. 395]|nr:hypothetical protein FRC09_004187 [Ceratobasidium sp. 395]